jgi:hypothetical protein
LLLRYADGTFSSTFITTIGIDFKINTVKIGDKTVKLQVPSASFHHLDYDFRAFLRADWCLSRWIDAIFRHMSTMRW